MRLRVAQAKKTLSPPRRFRRRAITLGMYTWLPGLDGEEAVGPLIAADRPSTDVFTKRSTALVRATQLPHQPLLELSSRRRSLATLADPQGWH